MFCSFSERYQLDLYRRWRRIPRCCWRDTSWRAGGCGNRRWVPRAAQRSTSRQSKQCECTAMNARTKIDISSLMWLATIFHSTNNYQFGDGWEPRPAFAPSVRDVLRRRRRRPRLRGEPRRPVRLLVPPRPGRALRQCHTGTTCFIICNQSNQ